MNYENLEIYNLSHKMAIDIHQMSMVLPKFENFEEGRQIRRSSKAVSVNIVEGYGRRRYKQDFIRFLIYSHSSCDETKEHLKYLHETESLKDKELYEDLLEEVDKVSRKINKYIQSIISN